MAKRGGFFWRACLVWAVFAAWSMRAWWDSTHDRVWEAAARDPDVYARNVAGGGAMCALFTVLLAMRRPEAPRGGRVARLLARAETLIRQGRLAEAEGVLAECKRLTGFVENDRHSKKGDSHGNVR